MLSFNWLTLRRVNNGLSVAVVLLAGYILIVPFLPGIAWWLKHSAPLISSAPNIELPASQTIPKDNRLVIPAIDINKPIVQGQSIYTVDKGIWIRPNANTPDKGGNTVLVGHRSSYTGPFGPFYNLDKLKAGDPVEIFWQGKAYVYKVAKMEVVSPDDVAVEAPTADTQLTLYTCTPLWTFTHRLVVIASEVSST